MAKTISLLALLFLCASAVNAGQQRASYRSPLIEYHFNEGQGTTAFDSSGHNRVGTLTAGPTWQKSKYGYSVYMDRTAEEYVSITDGPGLDPSVYTIVMVASANMVTGANTFLFNKGNGVLTVKLYGQSIGVCTGVAPCIDFLTTRSNCVTQNELISTQVIVATNTLTHIAVTMDSSGMKRIYINGRLDGSASGESQCTTDVTNPQIGASPTFGAGKGLIGTIDEFVWYDVALTQAEIRLMYNEYLNRNKKVTPQ